MATDRPTEAEFVEALRNYRSAVVDERIIDASSRRTAVLDIFRRALSRPAVPASEALLAEFDLGVEHVLRLNEEEVESCSKPDPKSGIACGDFDCLAQAITTDMRAAIAAEKARRGEPA